MGRPVHQTERFQNRSSGGLALSRVSPWNKREQRYRLCVTTLRVEEERSDSGQYVLRFGGRLDSQSTGAVWDRALRFATAAGSALLIVDTSELEYCDGSGSTLLMTLRERREARGAPIEFRGLSTETAQLIELLTPEAPALAETASRSGMIERLGRAAVAYLEDLRAALAFLGEVVVTLGRTLLRPSLIRGRDFFAVAERAGLGAVPIVTLVGFLLGLILAFQSAIPMRRFGAEIFIADFLGIAMFRELGPLLAAILLAARSGSAFAAEIGTMKVNEELDALTTMGLEPVRFLAVPRVLAAMVVVPTLTMLTSLAGLAGGAVVFRSLGFPLVTYINRIVDATTMSDLVGGLAKSLVLGLIVAVVGCMRGMSTGAGAGAVGESTTGSVVTGITLIAAAEGIFAVVFYVMGW